MSATRHLSASLEDYVEAIFFIMARKGAARAKDIADRLHVNSSSVTGALRSLAEKKLVNYAPYDVVTLTEDGERIARDVVRRHEALRDFFVSILGVDRTDAEDAACRLEHAIGRPVLERLIELVDFMKSCPRVGADWVERLCRSCRQSDELRDCEACLSQCLQDLRDAHPGSIADGAPCVSLAELRPGQRGRIVRAQPRSAAYRRLADMGVASGAVVEVERIAPPDAPIEIRVKGYRLSLCREEAEDLVIEIMPTHENAP